MIDLPPLIIAEDNDDDFYFFRRAVRAAQIDHPLLRFRDGAEFVRFAERFSPAARGAEPWLMFVDITMPIMNGFEVLEWLRARKERLPITPIVLSGSHRDEDIARGRALGAKDYLVKPVSPALLASLAFEHLRGAPADA